jgi:hypothetical protein
MVRTSIVWAELWLTLALGLAACGASTAFAENTDMPETLPDDDASAVSETERTAPPLRLEANLVALLAFPFKGDAGAMAFGFALTYGVGWGNIPLMLGLDFMSANSRVESSSETKTALDEQTRSVRTSARNRILYFDVWVRAQPPRWLVRPYIEGFIGTKLVQTQYALLLDGSTTALASSAHDWTNSIGWGAGVDLAGLLSIADSFSVTLGFRRLHGARATLDAHADVAGAAPVVIERNVATALTIYMLGVVGRFDLAASENSNRSFMSIR